MPVFLYIFLAKIAESVEENEGVAIFLPFFDRNVIFAVEENEGVAIFLYSCDKATTKSPMNDQNAVSACGRRLEKSRGAPSGALPYRMISGRKSGPARLPLFLFLKGRAAGGCPTAASRERWGKKRPVGAMEGLYFAIIEWMEPADRWFGLCVAGMVSMKEEG